ncbi:MAG: hypothetical protein WBP81_33290 [Solirubrobacteraceae bacterium]
MTVLLDSADSKAGDKVSAAIDTVLDRTIAFGYGSTGLLIRRHLAGWPADPPRIDGAVVLVTGPIIRTPEQGADTIVWLGAAPEALRSTGKFWHDRRPRPSHYPLGASEDSACDRQQLWNLCAKSLLAQATTASDPEFAA